MRSVFTVPLCLCLAAALYVGYGAFSLSDMADGFRKGDVDKIAAHVDFPAVRASLKEQASLAMMDVANSKKGSSDLERTIIRTIGPAMIANELETMITPDGMRKIMEARRSNVDFVNRQADLSTLPSRIKVLSPTQFRVADPATGLSFRIAFTDLTWKIVDARVPAETLREAFAR